jgi:hypothetical protein
MTLELSILLISTPGMAPECPAASQHAKRNTCVHSASRSNKLNAIITLMRTKNVRYNATFSIRLH